MGGIVGVAGPAAADVGGVSALSAVVYEHEVRRASQMTWEEGAMTPSLRGGVERMSAGRSA